MVERGYGRNFVEQQVDRARRIPRNKALREKPKKDNNRIPFTVTYHPGLPNIGGLLRELQPVLHSSIRCKDAIVVKRESRQCGFWERQPNLPTARRQVGLAAPKIRTGRDFLYTTSELPRAQHSTSCSPAG